MLMVNDAVRRLTLEKADAGSIRNAAVASGMVSLRAEGARKVIQGHDHARGSPAGDRRGRGLIRW
jgi:type II secretory ATPase GspE/PulE/Tfp pilus assembly ATPase PilB-like protein